MEQIKTAIIGYGLSGSVFHAPIISSLPEFLLSYIYTSDLEKQKSIHQRYPDVKIPTDLQSIFENDGVELVVIATPNTSHFSIAKQAILAGKNVVVDKPFTITSKEADELIDLAKSQNVILSVFQNRRWDSDFKTLRKVAESLLLGTIVECEMHMDRFRNQAKRSWREESLPGSGVLYDLGAHLIDQAQVMFGTPEAITADLRYQRKFAETVDNFEIVLHYGKKKVTLKSGMLVKISPAKYALHGENGSYVKYGEDVQEADLKAGYTPAKKLNWGVEPLEQRGHISVMTNGIEINGTVETEPGDYREYYRNIYQAMKENVDLIVQPIHGANTVRLIESAIKSNDQKKTIRVQLAEM